MASGYETLKYRKRLQRVVVVCGLFACMFALVVFYRLQVQTQAEQIKTLEASITADEMRIANLVAEVERLQDIEKAFDVPEVDPAVTSRGLPMVSGAFKSWMDYRTITNKTSKQYALQDKSETNAQGLRMYQGRYIVAMGTYYADEIGQEYRIYLSGGQVVDVVVGDIKSDAHTDSNRQYTRSNESVIEFVVDADKLSEMSRKMGTVTEFTGDIVRIEGVAE